MGKRYEYTAFDRKYDELMVDPDRLAPYLDETLSQEEVATLLGRMTTNYLHTLQLLEWQPTDLAQAAALQDPSELAKYYGNHVVTWRQAGEIVDSWLSDFQADSSTKENSPGASALR